MNENSNNAMLHTEEWPVHVVQHSVDILLLFDNHSMDEDRREMLVWCRENCVSNWSPQWLVADNAARFTFAAAPEAVAFKLRFGNL
jgi:hypothetical protein